MKKKLNIVLLVLVLCLWGTVIYRYLNQYFIKEQVLSQSNNSITVVENKILPKDTFELPKINRDPFHNTTKGEIKPPLRKTIPRKVVKEDKLKAVYKNPFPKIQYYGYIKSNGKSQETILLSADGKFLKLNLKQLNPNLASKL